MPCKRKRRLDPGQYRVSVNVDHPRSAGPRVLNEYVDADDPRDAEETAKRQLEEDGYKIREVIEVAPAGRYDPQFRYTRRAVRYARPAIRAARGVAGRVGARLKKRSRRPTTSRPPTYRAKVSRLYADPARLAKPIDLPGYDNLSAIRLVPFYKGNSQFMPVKGLIEGQIVQPQHQFIKTVETFNGDPEYGDIEFTDENGDGYIDRWIRRGLKSARSPRNLNLFVDIAEPMKDERLKLENWKLEEE